MSWRSRLVNVFRPSQVESDLDDEQRFHVDARIDDLVHRGSTQDEARAQALRTFGGRLRLRDASRDARVLPWLDSLVRDMRFGLRMLRKDALVSGAAVVSLALALGACAAAFSLVDALILRPLPVVDPQGLIYLTFPTGFAPVPEGETFSYPIFARMREAPGAQVELFTVSMRNARRVVLPGGDGRREEVRLQYVSGNALDVLGVRPALGRLVSPADDGAPGAHPVAVLSHAYWVRRFGGDPSVVGRSLLVNDNTSVEIVGVAERTFTGIEPGLLVDLWLPNAMYDRRAFDKAQWNWFRILGRLRPGADASRARVVLQHAFTDVRREAASGFPADHPRDAVRRYVDTTLSVRPAANGPSALRREFERPLLILSIVAGLVLLIATSNVASLLLARAAARTREMALRVSIGAGRARLVQLMMIESGMLAAIACVLALLVALASAPFVVGLLAPADDPAFLDLRMSGRLVGFLACLGTVTTMVFGLAPALRASGVAPAGGPDGSRARVSGRARLLKPLVAVEVAFSLAVLFLAGLLLLSFGRLTRVDLGFDKSGLLLATVESKELKEPGRAHEVAMQLLDRVRAIPGVRSASLSAWPIFSVGGWTNSVRIPGRPPDDVQVVHLAVSPGFLTTLRMRLLDGREFEARDVESASESPVIVNEAFARRYYGHTRIVGQTYNRPTDGRVLAQRIVGVVADAKYNDPREPAPPSVYIPLSGFGSLQVRTSGDPLTVTPAVRREVAAAHPSLFVSNVSLQSTLVDNALLRERLLALLSAFFGGVGLLLAAVGLYGVLSYSVVQRTREIGIRMALGAPRRVVVRSVLGDVASMTMLGAAAGLGGGLFLTRFVRSLLFEVQPLDFWSVALPILALLAAAVVAALRPALRAARVDPVVALRAE